MYLVDFEDDKSIVEFKSHVSATRDVLAGLAQLAQVLAERPGKRGYLVLMDAKLSKPTVYQLFQRFRSALRHEVAANLHVVVVSGDPDAPRPAELPTGAWEHLNRLKPRLGPVHSRMPRPQMQSEVLRVLLHQRYNGSGPLTAAWLAETVGCSYRTVAAAIDSLGSVVTRTRDRRVELAYFPDEAWRRLVATSRKARATVLYADRSGQPRSAEFLERKVRELGRADTAVGGVFGARWHLPSLDIVSAPRLDVCVHASQANVEPLPISQLDPGLVETTDSRAPVRLAVHFLRRRTSFFEVTIDGSRWADPVECLLDLHEARLDQQAQQLLDHLESKLRGVAGHDR